MIITQVVEQALLAQTIYCRVFTSLLIKATGSSRALIEQVQPPYLPLRLGDLEQIRRGHVFPLEVHELLPGALGDAIESPRTHTAAKTSSRHGTIYRSPVAHTRGAASPPECGKKYQVNMINSDANGLAVHTRTRTLLFFRRDEFIN